jgi:hypothetical protein
MTSMTPLAFAKKYLELEAYMYPLETGDGADDAGPGNVSEEGWRPLKVARYRLGPSTDGATAWRIQFWQDIAPHLTGPTTFKIKTISDETQEVTLAPEQLHFHFGFPFSGKGSPEQAQLAIQLVYRYHKATFTPEQFVDKEFIGLDCNGFVGNYIQRVVQDIPWLDANPDQDPGPTLKIGPMLELQGKDNQIQNLEDLQADETYLFGFCAPDGSIKDPVKGQAGSSGHVMITEPGTLEQIDQGWKIGVVEATAAGSRELRYLDYTITGVTKAGSGTVFQVLRGSPSDKMNVRVARLAMS